MKKKYWIRFTVVLSSVLALLLIRSVGNACGYGGPMTDEEYYSLYSPDMAGPSRLSPFFCTISAPYYKSPLDSLLPADTTDQYLSNTAEWKAYMNNKPSEKDIDKLVYKVKLKDMMTLQNNLVSMKTLLPDSLRSNSAIVYLQKNKDLEAINYLLFAKRCEPQVNVSYDAGGWGPLPARDTVQMKNLMEEGSYQRARSKNEFLRLRYAFQIVRLAHYSGQYSLCLELYDKFMAGNNPHSIVSLWGIALKGGALTRMKRGGEAAYIFAMLFDKHFNFNWELYHQNFNWASGNAIPYCQNDHERAVVRALQGFGMTENLPVMKDVAKYEPGSEYLDVLLTRQIRWMEHRLFADRYYQYPMDFAKKATPDLKQIQDTRAFILDMIQAGKTKRPWLWEFSAGYLSFFLHDHQSAKRYFTLAKAHSGRNNLLFCHISALEILEQVDEAPNVDKPLETSLFASLGKLRTSEMQKYTPDAVPVLFYNLGLRYLQQQDTLRFLLCTSQTQTQADLYHDPRAFQLDLLIFFLNKPDHTPYEQMLCDAFLKHYPVTALHELRGTAFMENYRFKEAVAELEQAGKLELLPADPFVERLKDCHDCDFDLKQGTYSKLTLCRKMLDLEKASDTPGAGAADAAYQLGNAYYNMSYYGNTWKALVYSRSNYDTAFQFFDCSTAAYFYEKARKLSPDQEFQAHCVYMLAKCEHNTFYFNSGTWYQADAKRIASKKDLKAFRQLREHYFQTLFYQDMIKECTYFKEWVRKNG
ncbi:MAG: hypothetical protein ACHQRM_04275 [Bacteroidia bacterium]